MIIDISRSAGALFALAVLAWAPCAATAPLPFLASEGNGLGTSVAGLDGDDFFEVAAPPDTLPIEGDAMAVSGDGDMAAAVARVGPGILGTGLDLTGVIGLTAADALASFAGDVLAPGGGVTLEVNFESVLALDAFGATGFTEMVYAVFSGGVALVDESVLLDGGHDRIGTLVHDLAPAAGSLLSLEAFLVSGAEAGPRGFAGGLASARFAFEAPPAMAASEPGAALLLAGGLVLLVGARPGRRASRVAGMRLR